jgi:hypothetical protein
MAWSRFAKFMDANETSYGSGVVANVNATRWEGKAAIAATAELQKYKKEISLISGEAGSVDGVLSGAVQDFSNAQRYLENSVAIADKLQLHVDTDGNVAVPPMSAADRHDPDSIAYWGKLRSVASTIEGRFWKARNLAKEADDRLQTALEGLGSSSFSGNGDLATQLAKTIDLPGHPLNVQPSLMTAARQAAQRYGISPDLLSMILWQEQQWYQNEGGTKGVMPWIGHQLNDGYQDYVDPTKSMGITHIKAQTALDVLSRDGVKDENGRLYNTYSPSDIGSKLEDDPRFAIDVTARYLGQIQGEPGGNWSDKQTFFIYAADGGNTRDNNRKYGDATDGRLGAIHQRGVNWDKVAPSIEAQQLWSRLSPADRNRALQQLGGQPTPHPGVSPTPWTPSSPTYDGLAYAELSHMDQAAHAADTLAAGVRSAIKGVIPSTDEAAQALNGWDSGPALTRLMSDWEQEIKTLNRQFENLGSALAATAKNYRSSEGSTTQTINSLWHVMG